MISRLFTRVQLGHVSRTRIRSEQPPATQPSLTELKAIYAAAVHGSEVVEQRDDRA